MWSAFFLYFLIFSCFPEARKAVKRFPNRECSYTELTFRNNGRKTLKNIISRRDGILLNS